MFMLQPMIVDWPSWCIYLYLFELAWKAEKENQSSLSLPQEEKCGCAHEMENIAEMQDSSRSSFYIRQLHSRVH